MKQILLAFVLCIALFDAAVRASDPMTQSSDSTRGWVAFNSFSYRGDDPFAQSVGEGEYLNPILAGFYPDPSVCRVGEDFYLVNSTFAYFPGVPIFHSRDLVNWRQIGNVLDRPSQLMMKKGLGVSGGIYAPTISYYGGKFYMVTTLVGGGGNFYVTADKPEGPWSDPIWLRDVHGIDPSFFVDDDGKAYVLNNGGPPDDKSLYGGHRAIWMQEMDFATAKPVGPRKIVVNGGVDISKHPVWIEGPHLMKKEGWYILHAAEGGTGPGHSQVVFRSRDVWGPYVPWDQNPILTQRDLPGNRPDPVTCIGHADIVDTADGKWWAVFLGCRPDHSGNELTGRETFLLPVTWTDGWPRILPPNTVLPRTPAKPALGSTDTNFSPSNITPPTTGSFSIIEDFDTAALGPQWLMLRTPTETWHALHDGALFLHPRPEPLAANGNPSYLARRLQHAKFVVETELDINADTLNSDAGLVAFQNDRFHIFLGVRVRDGQAASVFVERLWDRDKKDKIPPVPENLVSSNLPSASGKVRLRIACEGLKLTFAYQSGSGDWQVVAHDVDAAFLSTRVAGGFVGVTVGMHARLPVD